MSAPDKLPDVYWLTRDKIFGELSSRVDIWAVRPIPVEIANRDVIWKAPDELDVDGVDTCIGDWSLGQARRHVGNGIPTAENMCIRVGEPVVVSERERLAS